MSARSAACRLRVYVMGAQRLASRSLLLRPRTQAIAALAGESRTGGRTRLLDLAQPQPPPFSATFTPR